VKKKTTLEANSKFGHGRDSVVTSITSLDSKCGEVSPLLGSEEEAQQGVGEVLKKNFIKRTERSRREPLCLPLDTN
jgi:hypothetical protein